MSATCKGCGKPITYITNRDTLKKVPLDFDIKGAANNTDPKGALYYVDARVEIGIQVLDPIGVWNALRMDEPPDKVLIQTKGAKSGFMADSKRIGISHFRTCPNASSFGKGKR